MREKQLYLNIRIIFRTVVWIPQWVDAMLLQSPYVPGVCLCSRFGGPSLIPAPPTIQLLQAGMFPSFDQEAYSPISNSSSGLLSPKGI